MRHLRHVALAALAVGLCVPSVAGARGPSQVGGQLVPPYASVDGLSGGDAMGQAWARIYTLPAAENPAFGNSEPCVRLGRTGSILVGLEFQPVPCTVTQGTTVLVWGISNTCSSVEDPPYFAVGARAQRTCAAGLAPFVTSDRFTLDGGRPVDLQQRRFEIFSPQLGVQVPADNPFGAPPGAGTFTAWGQMAWLQHLPPGHHTIRTVTEFSDGSEPLVLSLVINVR